MLEYTIAPIIIIGIAVSYDDIKKGKIRNKYIIAGLFISLAIHIFALFANIITAQYFLWVAIYLLISLALGVVLWVLKIWTAGDAKLCLTFLSLIPLSTYQYTTTIVPSVDLIFNSAIPAALIVCGQLLIKTDSRQKIQSLKKTFQPKQLGKSLLYLYSMMWIITMAFTKLGFAQDYVLSLGILIILNILLKRVLGDNLYALMGVIAILRTAITPKILLQTNFLIPFVMITVGYLSIRLFVLNLENTSKENDRMPFAPFLFLGTLITIISQGNMIIFLRSVLL